MVSASAESIAMAQVAAQAASAKLATDVVILDVSAHLPLADVFVICTAANDRQMGAILDEVEDRLRELGHKPNHREGKSKDDWVLLSFPEIVVHVQTPTAREFYRLTTLWNDCPAVELSALAGDRR